VSGVSLDDAEVRSRWWSGGVEGAAGVAGVNSRLADLMGQIQFSEAETIVLVGHSHLLRELLRSQLSDRVGEADPALAKGLCSKKLSNCGVSRLELDFDAPGGAIVGCQLLAGTELVR